MPSSGYKETLVHIGKKTIERQLCHLEAALFAIVSPLFGRNVAKLV